MKTTAIPTGRALAAVAASLVALVVTADAGAAAKRPPIDALAVGTHVVSDDGSVEIDAVTVSYAVPYTGPVRATLTPDDGSLPDPGACEPARATYRLDGEKGRHLEVASVGTVCGTWTQTGVSGTGHVYTGRYRVVSSSPKRFERTDGFHDVRLSDTGDASSFIIDT